MNPNQRFNQWADQLHRQQQQEALRQQQEQMRRMQEAARQRSEMGAHAAVHRQQEEMRRQQQFTPIVPGTHSQWTAPVPTAGTHAPTYYEPETHRVWATILLLVGLALIVLCAGLASSFGWIGYAFLALLIVGTFWIVRRLWRGE